MSRVLVTGVAGCIGSWVARHLLDGSHHVIGVDVSDQDHRLRMLGVASRLAVERVDICDAAALEALIERSRPDAVIHLAAFQIPACKANPKRCVEVNIGGMMNMLEAARARSLPLVYASSAAVYGPELGHTLGEFEGVVPQNLYGVFKRADEEMARIYQQDYGVTSAGVRPYVVYGPGRDQGVTSDVTVALQHAMRGARFHIRFGGSTALQHASDVARAFIAAALAPKPGAAVYNLRGSVVPMAEVVRAIEAATGTTGLVTFEQKGLPIAADVSEAAFQAAYGPFHYIDLEAGFRQTVDVWKSAA
jgi:nucleoside-diphosphate-sugar epimerase